MAAGDALARGEEPSHPSANGASDVVGSHTSGVGSPLYCSPEQLGGRAYSEKSDVFSLGVILVEMHHVFTTKMERAKTLEVYTRAHAHHAHTYSRTHTHTHTHTDTRTHTRTHTNINTYTDIHTCNTRTHTHTYTYRHSVAASPRPRKTLLWQVPPLCTSLPCGS
jgi:serine/threonine protein kinase